jgi:hypothetical protein
MRIEQQKALIDLMLRACFELNIKIANVKYIIDMYGINAYINNRRARLSANSPYCIVRDNFLELIK